MAILNKYKEIYSGKVFKIEDDRELRGKMAKDKYEVLKNDSESKD